MRKNPSPARLFAGLDVTTRRIRWAIVRREGREASVCRIVAVPRDAGVPLDRQLLRTVESHRLAWDELHVAIPEGDAAHRRLTIPATDRKRLADVVPAAIAAVGLFPVGAPGTDPRERYGHGHEIVEDQGPGVTVCAAVCRQTSLDGVRDALGAAGLVADSVRLGTWAAASFIAEESGSRTIGFLDLTAELPTLAVLGKGRILWLRRLFVRLPEVDTKDDGTLDEIAGEIRWSLAARSTEVPASWVVAGESTDTRKNWNELIGRDSHAQVRDLSDVPLAGVPPQWRALQGESIVAVGLAMRAATGRARGPGFATGNPHGQPISLPHRPGESSERGQRRSLVDTRLTRALAAALLLLALLDAGVRYGFARHHAHEIGARLSDTLSHPLLQGTPRALLDDPEGLKATLTGLESSIRVARRPALETLRELSLRWGSSGDVVLRSLAIDGKRLRLAGRAKSDRALESARHSLHESGCFGRLQTEETTDVGPFVDFEIEAFIERCSPASRARGETPEKHGA